MLLREQGYACQEGVIYFAGSRERVTVVLDAALETLTLETITALRAMAASGQIPPPLEDSPKCVRCSLVGICLPDEVQFFAGGSTPVRPLSVAAADALPFYVQNVQARVGKEGDSLVVRVENEKVAEVGLARVSPPIPPTLFF
ncbi:MAG: CRISPR-associated protein Cas4 [Magnetococcus sp. DMHC-6]